MGLDQCPAERQAQSGAVEITAHRGLDLAERRQRLGNVARRDADPGVGHGDRQTGRAVGRRRERDPPTTVPPRNQTRRAGLGNQG